ncbi:Ig-like domain-containing protein [Verminephrobacter aporrectodeae]|uniref:Ig-like domain-containing protein n=1 Tax=Verminephrobacter aporrectodeae TaxID=1110389 RepID=UPI0022440DA5|nr:Ig-like domain-containing protein [Verminephrobacter aporrectodeae]
MTIAPIKVRVWADTYTFESDGEERTVLHLQLDDWPEWSIYMLPDDHSFGYNTPLEPICWLYDSSDKLRGYAQLERAPHNEHLWLSLSVGDGATQWHSDSVDLGRMIAPDGGWRNMGDMFFDMLPTDTVRPKPRSITIDDEHLQVDETATVTFVFSEKVANFQSAIDLSKAHGTLGSLTTVDGGITWTAPFTPTANTDAEKCVISVRMNEVRDLYGNPGTDLNGGNTPVNSNGYAVNTTRPSLATAGHTIDDNQLGMGQTAHVRIKFSVAVKGFDASDVILAPGSGSVRQVLASQPAADGSSDTWEVVLDAPGADGAASTNNPISVNLAGVSTRAGNAGQGTVATGLSYGVDLTRPTLLSTRISYGAGETDNILKLGETALVIFTFSEAVTNFDLDDLRMTKGPRSGTLSQPVSTGDGSVWIATLSAPAPGVTSSNNAMRVNLSDVHDLAGNAGEGVVLAGVRYDIDTFGERPTLRITLADTLLTVGETTLVTFDFNQVVTGFDADDIVLTHANGTLGVLTAGANGKTWTAPFTPATNTENASSTIRVDLTGVRNAAGTPGIGSATSANYSVDTWPADTTGPTVTITLADVRLAVGESTTVTFAFNEVVTGFTRDDVELYEANGTLGDLTTHDDGRTWTATFTPKANAESWTNTIRVNHAGVANTAGRAGTGRADSPNYQVDTRAPVCYRALVNSARLMLLYGEGVGLDMTHIPPTTAFAVHVDTVRTAVVTVRVNAHNTVSLMLATPVTSGQAVTVAYTDPTTGNDAHAMQDMAGNDAASFSARPVDNRTSAPQGSARSAPLTPSDPTHKNADNDGIPGPAGAAPVAGDGNGDGIPDSTQAAVHSTRLVLSSPTGANQPADAVRTPVTLVAGSLDGKLDPDSSGARITHLEQEDAPAELPQGMETPLGLLRFEATLAPSHSSEAFSLYVDPALGINGYWARDSAGHWVNLSSAPYGGQVAHEGGQLRLDFEIADGGPFDADGQANGAITAPGAVARMPLSLVGQTPDAAGDLWF